MGKDSLLGAEELRERRREEELELEQAIWPPWRHEVEVWLFERQREAEEEAAKEEFYWEEVQRVEGMRQVAAWSDQTAAQQNLEMVLMAAKETNLALMTLRQQPL